MLCKYYIDIYYSLYDEHYSNLITLKSKTYCRPLFKSYLPRICKMVKSQFLVFVSAIISLSHADFIHKIDVRTADCDDCGMSNTFGALRMQICNAFKDCCSTSKLDVPFHNDFDEGAIDSFEGSNILNECNIFDMKNSSPKLIQMSLYHEGTDGYQADWIQVGTEVGFYKCYFSKFLDGEAFEDGMNCISY